MPQLANSLGFTLPDHVPEGARNTTLHSYICSLQAKSWKDEDILEEALAANQRVCDPPLPESEVRATVNNVLTSKAKGHSPEFDAELAKRRRTYVPASGGQGDGAEGGDDGGAGLLWGDKELSREFARRYSDRLRYRKDAGEKAGTWMAYDGTVWEETGKDEGSEPFKLVKEFVDDLEREVSRMPDGDSKKFARKQLIKYSSYSNARHIVDFAASEMVCGSSDFDRNLNLVNCKNCTFNLDTMKPQGHSAKDMLTMVCGCDYDPNADGGQWEEFVTTACTDKDGRPDPDLELFLQETMGATLKGDTRRHRAYAVYGPGRTGKSTFCAVVAAAFGGYSITMNKETLSASGERDGGAPTPDLADLEGKRLAVCFELKQGALLDAALFKQLTGGDRLRTRQMYGRFKETKVKATIWMCTNDLPDVNDRTVLDTGRIVIVPFDNYHPEEGRDLDLEEELTTPGNLSAVLNWLIAGAYMSRNLGFDLPERCENLQTEYSEDNDKVGMFLAERCTVGPGRVARGMELFEAYKEWCEANGCYSGSNRKFYAELERREGIVRHRSYRVNGEVVSNMFEGVELRRGM